MSIRTIVFTAWLFLLASTAQAKLALLVGVTKYKHSQLNQTQLKFPEDDAKAIGELLETSGYKVQLLMGSQATVTAIREAMKELAQQGDGDSVLLLGFFGHGVQYNHSAYYCPYDTQLRVVTDADGKELRDNGGLLRQEPDPDSMISMREMLDALTISKAGGKLLLADCCREDPSRARGLRSRAFGEGLQVDQLPTNSAALFACSAGEQAYEHDDWKHGAFTRAFLDVCSTRAEVTANELSALVHHRVNELVASKTGIHSKQTVSNVIRDLVDLKLNRRLSTKAPETFINSVGSALKLIPPGSFMMGSNLTAKEVQEQYPGGKASEVEDEHPRHRVTLTRSFYIGIHEVTVGQFRMFVEATKYRSEAERNAQGGYGLVANTGSYRQGPEFSWRNPGFKQRDNEPVVNISWNDACEFCNWLSQQESRKYRLPTEAEWEYACRAGSKTEFYFGNKAEDLAAYANIESLAAPKKPSAEAKTAANDGYLTTAPVGSFRPNAFGLADMHGNVWEWCADGYGKYNSAEETDPAGPASRQLRVVRGGSWRDIPKHCRSAGRFGNSPKSVGISLGFRVVSEP